MAVGPSGTGWMWVSSTRKQKSLSQDSVGLRLVANKLHMRRRKELEARLKKDTSAGSDTSPCVVKMEADEEKPFVKKEECTQDKVSSESVKNKNEQTGACVPKEEPMDTEPAQASGEGEGSRNEDNRLSTANSSSSSMVCKDEASFTPVDSKHRAPSGLEIGTIENMNVSEAMVNRTHYPKLTKPYSRLDQLLDKRYKQWEIEQKQKLAFEQVLLRYRTQEAAEKSKDKAQDHDAKDKVKEKDKVSGTNGTNDQESIENASKKEDKGSTYLCYSLCCRHTNKSRDKRSSYKCYSVVCRSMKAKKKKERNELQDSELMRTLDLPNGDIDDSSQEEEDDDDEEEEVDVTGTQESDDKEKSKEKETVESKDKNSEEKVEEEKPKPVSDATDSKDKATPSGSGNPQPNTVASMTQALQALIQGGKIQITPQLVKDIEKKLDMIGKTQYKVSLIKNRRGPTPRGGPAPRSLIKKGSLPQCHKYMTKSKMRSLFVLEKPYLKKLARKAGRKETVGFKYDCKMNNVNWPYPCPRPQFKTAWRFRTQTLKNLAAAALQLRIIWSSLRWDDLSQKPQAGGTNTVTTETDITTTELLKRRDIGPYQLRSEFLVRKIVVPIGVPNTMPKGRIINSFHFI